MNRYIYNILFATFAKSAIFFLTYNTSSFAGEACISLLQPAPSPAYSNILDDIQRGIIGIADKKIKIHTINKNTTSTDLENEICDLVIGIGHAGMNLATQLDKRSVSGAVFIPPQATPSHPIFSLIPEPKELFLRLKFFDKNIRRIEVVYSNKYSSGLIHRAKKQALSMGLELIPHPTSSLKDSLRTYQKLFSDNIKSDTALWVLQDPLTIDNNIILTYLLEQSWNNKILMFSSQASLAKHGALFSVYPDNVALGKHLVMALNQLSKEGGHQASINLLQDLNTAFNTRTASHLGIRYKRGEYVDQVFP